MTLCSQVIFAREKPVTDELIAQVQELNQKNEVLSAWKILAGQGDGYAKTAGKIFSEEVTLEGCIVRANWDNIVGKSVRRELFGKYAQLYQSHYIEFLNVNRNYPHTADIEKMYQIADDELGLPQSVSVDLMLNLVPVESIRKFFSDGFSNLIFFGGFSFSKKWYQFTKISKSRISEEFITAQDITPRQADKIMWRTARKAGSCWLKGRGLVIEGY